MKHTEYCKKNCQDCANRLPLRDKDKYDFMRENPDDFRVCDFDDAYILASRTKACHGYRDKEHKDAESE